jgi:hypothetical protein
VVVDAAVGGVLPGAEFEAAAVAAIRQWRAAPTNRAAAATATGTASHAAVNAAGTATTA